MNKTLNAKLAELKATWQQYLRSNEDLNTLKLHRDILYDLYLAQAEKIAQELRKRNLTEIKTDEGIFKLKRLVNAKIIDRDQADAFDQKYKLGLFQKSICGPKVKSWVTQQLEKNLKIPDFVEVLAIWTIDIRLD